MCLVVCFVVSWALVCWLFLSDVSFPHNDVVAGAQWVRE